MPPDKVQKAQSAPIVKDNRNKAKNKLSMMTKKSVGFFEGMDDKEFEKLKSWQKWVIINSRPKEEPELVFEPVNTRWAPLAPMTRNDWDGWKKWVDEKGIPKAKQYPVQLPPSKKVPLSKLKDRIEKLAVSKWPPIPRPVAATCPEKSKAKVKE